MKTILSFLLFAWFVPHVCSADDDFILDMWKGEAAKLTDAEKRALRHSEQKRQRGVMPVVDPSGKVVLAFGRGQPTVVCSPWTLSVIELQPGERVQYWGVGDGHNWTVQRQQGRRGRKDVPLFVVKARDVGLVTALFIMSDRRTYTIELKSVSKEYMAHIAFSYPDDPLVYDTKVTAPGDVTRERASLKQKQYSPLDLDYQYAVSTKNDPRWVPERVYNDGAFTYIEMPKEMMRGSAPNLYLIGQEEDPELVMYTLDDGKFVVETVFDVAVLLTGIGRDETRVTIRRAP